MGCCQERFPYRIEIQKQVQGGDTFSSVLSFPKLFYENADIGEHILSMSQLCNEDIDKTIRFALVDRHDIIFDTYETTVRDL